MKKQKMNKVKLNRICWHSYCSDTGGCGVIRTWIPTIILTQWRYKNFCFLGTYGYKYVFDKEFYKGDLFVKFQRPAESTHLQLVNDFISRINNKKIPLFLEFDDLVFNIPETNGASKYYKDREFFIKKMMEIVDGITVSTETLANEYSKYNKNISVVPNYLPKFIFGENHWKEKEYKKPRILYPGSFNHFNQNGPGGDFSNKLIEFIKKTLDEYEWHFIGGCPFELKNNSKIFLHPWQSYFNYPNKIKEINPTIAIAPLENNFFNKCKSNIKFLEYSALGIPGIYSNITPYKKANCLCNSSEEMIEKIIDVCKDTNKQKEIWQNDFNTTKNCLYLEGNELNWINKHLKLLKKKI